MDAYCQKKPTKDLLVVEDHHDIQRLYQQIVAPLPYRMDVVDSGNAALAALIATRYRVLIVDVGLPDIEGTALCRNLRSDAALGHRDQPIVMVSALGACIESACLSAGANHFFVKTDSVRPTFQETIARYVASSGPPDRFL